MVLEILNKIIIRITYSTRRRSFFSSRTLSRVHPSIFVFESESSTIMDQELDVLAALEKAYRDALTSFKADKTNKDLRRARTAAKKAWDAAVLDDCLAKGDKGAHQLYCIDCSQMFLWTTEDQEYYKSAERNWQHKPQRCRKCAESQKGRRIEKNQNEINSSNDDDRSTGKGGKAGKNMCWAFQRGECRYGDRCKFNHDPEFAGKPKEDDEDDEANNSDENGDGDDESNKKRKIVPEEIAICKWGKDCKMKRCRYRHDIDGDNDNGNGNGVSPQSAPTTNPLNANKEDGFKNKETENESTPQIVANSSSKKPKVMGICKWGKNCKLKRCRFRHEDESSSSSSTSIPSLLFEKEKDDVCVKVTGSSVTTAVSAATQDVAAEPSTSAIGTKETKKKTKTKSKTKPADKLVHKAMKKALKKAPKNKLRVKDLRKLLRKKMEDMGKDEIKFVIKETIAKNKNSMALLEDGTVVKLLV